MFLFLFLLIVTLFCCKQDYNKQKKNFVYIIGVMMILCGFRGETVGADTHNYIDFAKRLVDVDFGFFYTFLYQCTVFLGGHENIFLMLMSVFTYIPLYYIIKRESSLPVLSVLIYMISSTRFYLETFNISRQSIAIIFLLGSYCLFQHKKYKGTVISFLCAVCFHKSSLIVLPFYILNNVRLPKERYIYILLGISVIIGLSDTTAFISDILTLLYSFSESGSDLAYLGKYADRELNLDWNFVGKLSHCVPITLLTAFTYSKTNSDSFLYKMMFVGTIVLNVLLTNRYCERFASMLLITQIITVPIALNDLRGHKKRLLKLIIGGLALYYVIILKQQMGIVNSDYNYVMPYKFFFER